MSKLIIPNANFYESYQSLLAESADSNEKYYSLIDKPNISMEQLFSRLADERNGTALRDGHVQATQYWLVDGSEVIGIGNVRHRLNNALEKHGGHIGYYIRPSKRGRGYGKLLLTLLLGKSADIGIKNALLTCSATDKVSLKLITRAGGVKINDCFSDIKDDLLYLIDTGISIKRTMSTFFRHKRTGRIFGEEIDLVLSQYIPRNRDDDWCPAYEFWICQTGEDKQIGRIDLRIGFNEGLYYGGHIGYNIFEEYRGRHYAEKACRLLVPLAKKHKQRTLTITCNPDNYASIKTIERLGAEYLELVRIPEHNDQFFRGERFKRRYIWRTWQ